MNNWLGVETSILRGLHILWRALYGYFRAFFLKVVFIDKDFLGRKTSRARQVGELDRKRPEAQASGEYVPGS